ncbi:hypothetical protein L0663_06675 [Dyadobacter sp. CY107]|uniref:hypothetical protein n=1 Tax=Dyadobacter fanqingshengii TaxID=2906443 RepID=UPI001F47F59A|nr:hypothetical protein [Dyadobacter fanqingshengii]MCF2503051.1 hypothetical protein [Dyadobacter fanqingshengii]
MKKQIYLLIAAACILASCAKKESESTTVVESDAQPGSECYAYTTEKDSAFLHIEVTADSIVTGDLEYNLFEKDQNRGKIDGQIHGDTLLANYKFMSEGVESTREVAFLKKDGNWVEGFGPVGEKNGAMLFSDRSKLDFAKGLVFKTAACP